VGGKDQGILRDECRNLMGFFRIWYVNAWAQAPWFHGADTPTVNLHKVSE